MNNDSEKCSPPPPKARPVTINIAPSNSNFSEYSEPQHPSAVSTARSPTENLQPPSAGRLTLSLVTMVPDEEQPYRPVRTLSLRLRPDDSWIVKHHVSEEADQGAKSNSAIPPDNPTSVTLSEEVEEVIRSEQAMGGVTTANACPTLAFRNAMPTAIAASQQ